MVTAEDESVARAPQNCLHSPPVSFDASCLRVMQPPAVHRAPEVRIEFEVGAAPLAIHNPKQVFKMLLRRGMGTVERVPGSAPPTAERDTIGAHWIPFPVFHEPIRMVPEHARVLFRDEGSDPDCRFEASLTNLLEHAAHIAAEC